MSAAWPAPAWRSRMAPRGQLSLLPNLLQASGCATPAARAAAITPNRLAPDRSRYFTTRPPLPTEKKTACRDRGGLAQNRNCACHAPESRMRRTSSRNSFNSNGLEMNPSAPIARPLRRSMAEPRAVIIKIFTSARFGSSRTPRQIS